MDHEPDVCSVKAAPPPWLVNLVAALDLADADPIQLAPHFEQALLDPCGARADLEEACRRVVLRHGTYGLQRLHRHVRTPLARGLQVLQDLEQKATGL